MHRRVNGPHLAGATVRPLRLCPVGSSRNWFCSSLLFYLASIGRLINLPVKSQSGSRKAKTGESGLGLAWENALGISQMILAEFDSKRDLNSENLDVSSGLPCRPARRPDNDFLPSIFQMIFSLSKIIWELILTHTNLKPSQNRIKCCVYWHTWRCQSPPTAWVTLSSYWLNSLPKPCCKAIYLATHPCLYWIQDQLDCTKHNRRLSSSQDKCAKCAMVFVILMM